MLEVYHGDNLEIIKNFQDASFDLIYCDPPFGTGKKQVRGELSYADNHDDYMAFLEPRLQEVFRLLKPNGSFFLHLDYREVHYAKVALDKIFGRPSFINEIIWSYDYGARSRKKWPTKHDNILWYAKNPNDYCFNYSEIDRIPYMAPGLVGKEKAAKGKTLTDVWWNTIVPTNGKENLKYPTQKPLKILERIVRVHSRPGDKLLDFFAGSGSFGEAALKNNRQVVLVDSNTQAIEIITKRLAKYKEEHD